MHKRFQYCALVLIIFLTSCGEEDRIVTVSCLPPPYDKVAFNFDQNEAMHLGTGQLNSEQFAAGTILRLIPGVLPSQVGVTREAYALKTAQKDFLPSRSFSPITTPIWNIRVEADADVEQAANSLGVDIESLVKRGTMFWIDDGELRALRNVSALVNSDARAVEIVREDLHDARFVVVSGVVDGTGGRLISSLAPLKFVAFNVAKLADFYVHLEYSCPAIDTVGAEGMREDEKRLPILFFYTAIRYDYSTSSVTIDKRPLDLARFTFAKRSNRSGS